MTDQGPRMANLLVAAYYRKYYNRKPPNLWRSLLFDEYYEKHNHKWKTLTLPYATHSLTI